MLSLPNCTPIAAYADLTNDGWLNARKTGIGGSDAYNVAFSPLSVWMDKTGRVGPKHLENDEENGPVDDGKDLEEDIRKYILPKYLKKYAKLGGFEILDPTHMYRSNNNPFMVINPDGFIFLPEIWEHREIGRDRQVQREKLVGLEIKTGSSYMLKHWGGVHGDSVPDRYYYQVQHYLAGTGLDEWWIFGLIGSRRLLRIVPRNEEFITDLIAQERDLWKLVEINDPMFAPMPMGSDDDMDALLALGSPQTESTVDLSEIEHLIARRLDLKIERDDKTEEWEKLDQKIRFVMGGSRYGESQNYKLTHARWYSKHFDEDRFKREHPELYREYTVVNDKESSRLFVSHR